MDSFYPNLLTWALDESLIGDRMVLIAGPRQIGKTTLVRDYLTSLKIPELYFNWDTAVVRQAYAANPDFFIPQKLQLFRKKAVIVFDELHKYPHWKSHLKGLYDSWKDRIRFIVTGSARLDFMRRSGDSLVGRYFLFRKFPIHPREWVRRSPSLPDWDPTQPLQLPALSSAAWREAIQSLFDLNGFPEPLLKGSQRFLNRWQSEHLSLLVTEDLADLTKIDQVLRVEELALLLKTKVGSPLSINRLAQDLKVSFATVRRWIEALELVYLCFKVPPYSKKLARSIQKEEKLYFWDWSLVSDAGARFENMVAVFLARAVASWSERGLGQFQLYYVRTRDGVEVDFLVTQQEKPFVLVETKLSELEVHSSVLKMKHWLNVPHAWQVLNQFQILKPHREEGVWSIGIDSLLELLP